jgi:hypothetical protein
MVNTTTTSGNVTFYLKGYASGASVFTAISSELIATGNLTRAGGIPTTVVLPVVNYGTAPLTGGTVLNCGAVTGLPAINPALNPYVTFELTMSGIGSTIFTTIGNTIEVGIFKDLATTVAIFADGGTPVPSFNWGTSVPNALNEVVLVRTVPYASYIGSLNYCAFINFTYSASPFYTITNLQFQLTVTYNA